MAYHETVNGHQIENRAGSFKCTRCGLTGLSKKTFERKDCEDTNGDQIEFD